MQRNLHQQEGVMVCLISDTFDFSRDCQAKNNKKEHFLDSCLGEALIFSPLKKWTLYFQAPALLWDSAQNTCQLAHQVKLKSQSSSKLCLPGT
jgi:hypothetical protein